MGGSNGCVTDLRSRRGGEEARAVSRFRLHMSEGRLCLAERGQPKSPISVDFDSPS